MHKLQRSMCIGVMETLDLADLLCQSIDMFAEVGVSIRDPRSPLDATIGHWVGQIPPTVNSKAPVVWLQKMAALVATEQRDGINQLILTPVPGLEEMMEWQGGVAMNGIRVAVSKWAQEWDRLLALILLYHKLNDNALALHHAGFSYVNRSDRDIELTKAENWLERPAEDHERHYLPMYVGDDGQTIYRELQLGFDHDGRHWDFVVKGRDPVKFLWWIANAYEVEPTLWEPGSNDPVGVVWIPDPTGNMPFSKLGVMARAHYWNIEEE